MNRRTATVFIDALFLMLLVLVLLPHKPDEAKADDARVGDLVVEISWPDCQRSDVDLWVRSPGDMPVGYSRLRGRHVSLLRDDLGTSYTECDREELAASRALVDGEWIVNVHLYTDADGAAPFPVKVNVWYRAEGAVRRRTVWQGSVDLERKGHEVTAVRWTMQDNRVLAGSLHHSPIELRAARGTQGGGI